MTIDESRREYWSKNYTAKQMGDSLAMPFPNYKKICKNKKILEIGPGEGRQFELVRRWTRHISIADITEDVLNDEKYKRVPVKLLINSYDDDFGIKFDVIHFWYVLHHVKHEELESFFDFTLRHLEPEYGMLIFNTPVTDYPDPAYGNDGILTTKHTLTEIGAILDKHFYWEANRSLYGNANGYIIVANVR